MEKESLAFVMVGHVDHGKSTMIGRLLCDTDSLPDGKLAEIEAAARAEGRELEIGFVMDHLHEERERGITIDTAQTFFSSPRRDYVIIDAPGHKEFIKNMITGASQAEAAILICSVAEGVQEQTKRHAYVLRLLGLDQVVVAYNKMDLVGYEQDSFRRVKGQMDDFLGRLGISPSVEVPISAHLGDNVALASENMPWYDGPTVVAALDVFRKTPPPTAKPLRFPVQDVYEADGAGRMVVGRVESGVLRSGEGLRFLPGERTWTVPPIKRYGEEDSSSAEPGECIGLLFEGEAPRRGQVGCPEADLPALTRRFGASVFWLSPSPLRQEAGEEDGLAFRCATQEQPCRVVEVQERIDSGTLEHLPLDDAGLRETEVGELILETDAPVVVESFYDVQELGRFVLARGQDVVAGGIVTRTRD
ncbi:MAG: GTP-binding protein [Planctomycetota bacterium]|jgi:sulfate adenylyltransferase subunit 1 (EFTu-like GTPase family)